VSEELPPSSEEAIVSSPEPLALQEAPKEEAQATVEVAEEL